MIETNQAFISGKLVLGFPTVTTTRRMKYYIADMLVRRLSGVEDFIPIKVPGGLIVKYTDYRGQYVSITGQYQTRNYFDGQKNRLEQYIYVEKMELWDSDRGMDDNYIFLNGTICKKPIYRNTPLGRSITNLLIAVNTSKGMSYYIPCICWGSTAEYAGSLSVGERIEITGRMQSREYNKRINDFTFEKRIAYEVSVLKLGFDKIKIVPSMSCSISCAISSLMR